jgi:anti-sigma factor RsiW
MEQDAEKHIEEDLLEAYAMNTLAEGELEKVEEHLLFCVTCQNHLDTVDRHVQAMQGAARRIRKEEAGSPARSRVTVAAKLVDWLRSAVRFPLPVWAGAAVLAVLAIVIVMIPRSEEKPGPAVDVELHASRGASQGTAPAGHALHLLLDSRGVPEMPQWPIEIVDDDGARVWTGTGKPVGDYITATAETAFHPGTYFVRLQKEGSDPVREYQLIIDKPPQP